MKLFGQKGKEKGKKETWKTAKQVLWESHYFPVMMNL